MFEQQEPNGRPFRQRDFSASLRPMPYGVNTLKPAGQRHVALLPGLLGQIEEALTASGADQASVVGHLCAIASLMAQGIADGAWPNDCVLPAGCSTMTVVPSGVGKSLITDLLLNPVRRAWNSREVPSRDRKRNSRQEPQHAREDSEEENEGPAPTLLVEDATSPALVQHLISWPVIGLFTDETAMLADLLRKDAGLLAKLSDGTPYSRSRGLTRRVTITGHRFVMLFQAQPNVFQRNRIFLGASGGGGIGFINRVLLLKSAKTSLETNNFSVKLPPALAAGYEFRIEELMDMSIEAVGCGIERPVVSLSSAAKNALEANQREVRAQWGQVTYMGEYVNRHAERTLRLATALHTFEVGPIGEISVETLACADAIGRRSLEDFFALAVPPRKTSRAERDAHFLANAFIQLNGGHLFPIHVPYKFVMGNAMNLALSSAQLGAALRILAKQGLLFTYGEGRQKAISVDLLRLRMWMSDNSPDDDNSQLVRLGGTI